MSPRAGDRRTDRSAPTSALTLDLGGPTALTAPPAAGAACKRILHGLWQTSGGWGRIQPGPAVDTMATLASRGWTTYDGADHYGPAEDLMGGLRERLAAQHGGAVPEAAAQMFTKWCPRPARYSRAAVRAAVDRSLSRMKTPTLDLLQLHWWDYAARDELAEVLAHLAAEKAEGRIRELALTNFDTEHLRWMVEDLALPIAANQVQYSVVDTRPGARMAPLAARHGVQLLCYGTLMGGLLTEAWLGKPAPAAQLPTPSLGKYYNMVRAWGGWPLFQEMLAMLAGIAARHSEALPAGTPRYTLSHVALKWVLDQPAVGGVIVGLRAGLSEHADDNARAFGLALTDADRAAIAAVQAKGRDLLQVIGDCGDEYR